MFTFAISDFLLTAWLRAVVVEATSAFRPKPNAAMKRCKLRAGTQQPASNQQATSKQPASNQQATSKQATSKQPASKQQATSKQAASNQQATSKQPAGNQQATSKQPASNHQQATSKQAASKQPTAHSPTHPANLFTRSPTDQLTHPLTRPSSHSPNRPTPCRCAQSDSIPHTTWVGLNNM